MLAATIKCGKPVLLNFCLCAVTAEPGLSLTPLPLQADKGEEVPAAYKTAGTVQALPSDTPSTLTGSTATTPTTTVTTSPLTGDDIFDRSTRRQIMVLLWILATLALVLAALAAASACCLLCCCCCCSPDSVLCLAGPCAALCCVCCQEEGDDCCTPLCCAEMLCLGGCAALGGQPGRAGW